MGREQANALVLGATSKMARAEKQEAVGGLSQEELDTLAITAEEAEPCSQDSGFLLRVRRARHFMGNEAADAMIADARTRIPEAKESADENITTASGSLSRQSSGSGCLSLKAGLSQVELNALIVSAEESEEPCAPECSEGFLLRVRRARHFMGNEAAYALITDAVQAMKDEDVGDNTASGSEDSTASGSEDKEASDVGLLSRRTSASGACEDKEAGDVGLLSRRTSASGAGSINLPLSGFSQAELDALEEVEPIEEVAKSCVWAEISIEEVAKSCSSADMTQKGRSKFAGLEIDPDPVSDACAILQQVSSPIGGRRGGSIRFTSGPLSPQHSPTTIRRSVF